MIEIFYFNLKPCLIEENLVEYCLEKRFQKQRIFLRDIAQLGRAPALGAGCRRFKSYYPDFSTTIL